MGVGIGMGVGMGITLGLPEHLLQRQEFEKRLLQHPNMISSFLARNVLPCHIPRRYVSLPFQYILAKLRLCESFILKYVILLVEKKAENK